MRRLITFLTLAAITSVGLLNWLVDGDILATVEPVVAEWDAELLARRAGLEAPADGQGSEDALQDAADDAP